jgi:hypothetical protein
MSKAIVREKFRDFFKGKLSFEERTEIREAFNSLYGIITEYDALAAPYLVKYSEGYLTQEIAQMYGTDESSVKETLLYTFSLFGEVLQLDDEILLKRLDKPLRSVAATIFQKIYREFVEVE